jgi:hypothetical protein
MRIAAGGGCGPQFFLILDTRLEAGLFHFGVVTLCLISQPTFCPIVHRGFDNSSLSDAAGKNHMCFAVIVCQDGRILISPSYYFAVDSV